MPATPRLRSSWRQRTAVLDDDLRQVHRGAALSRQRVGIASARSSPKAGGRRGWLEAILRRMVSESARERPGQSVALSRLTEVLFVEVLRSWIKSLGPSEGGWLGAMADPHIGPALQLIHEQPDRPWTLDELGQRVGLGRSTFSARFTRLVGQSMYRYLIARRMEQAAFLLESSHDGIARIGIRVGYETVAAFSKVFLRYHGLSPGRYRQVRRSGGAGRRGSVLEAEVAE